MELLELPFRMNASNAVIQIIYYICNYDISELIKYGYAPSRLQNYNLLFREGTDSINLLIPYFASGRAP